MTYKVWYTRVFDEAGDVYEGGDFIEFNTLSDAWNYFTTISDTDRNKQLWAGNDRLH